MDSVLIPGYKIERELGQGGMARVYLAMHDRLQRPVALKVMAMHLLDDPQYGERFLREARIVARLTHPNIVHVYDVDRFENYHYIAMEFIRGGSLTDRARAGIGVRASLRTIKQIASALDYAHEEGCIHRDVKPDNILFRNDTTAVLSDFGIAKDDSRKTRVTQSGLAVGTPHYMSPEQARGKPVDGRSDFYALGVMLFELLEGHVPFDGETSVAIGIKHITEPVPRLLEDHALLQPLIDWMLEKDPIKRVPNGTAVIEAIEKLETDPAFQALTQHDPVEKLGKNSGPRSGLQAQTHSGDQHGGLASGVQPKASDPAAATSAVESVAPPPGTVVVPIGEIAGLQQSAPAASPAPAPAPAQPPAPVPAAQAPVSQPVPVVRQPTPPPTEPARPVSSPTIGIDAAEVASRTPPPQTVVVEPVPEARVTPPPKRSASGTSHMTSVSDAALNAVHPPGTSVMGALQPGAENWQGANPVRATPATKRSPVAIAIAACVLVAVAGVAFVLMQPDGDIESSSSEQVASQQSGTDTDSQVDAGAQTVTQPADETKPNAAVAAADTTATVPAESASNEPVKTVTTPVKEAEPVAKVEPEIPENKPVSKPVTESVASAADSTAKQVTRLLTSAGAAEKNHQYDAAFKAYGDAIKLEGKQGKASRQRDELVTKLIDEASQALVADNVGEAKSLLSLLQREAPKRPAVQTLSDNLNNKLAEQEAELAAQNARAGEIERLLQNADNKLNSAPATVTSLQQAVTDYDKVLALDPDERRAKKGKRDVLDRMASQANEAANALDVAAVGSWLSAIEKLDGSSSQAARTRALLASTQQAVKKRDEEKVLAIAQSGEAAKLNNMAAALRQQMTSSQLKDADFARLEKSLAELKKADTNNAVYPQMRNELADAYYRVAKSEFDQGGSRRAEALITRGLRLLPNHGNMVYLRQQMEAIEAKKKEDVAQPIVF